MTAPDTDHAAKLWELIHTGGIEFDGEMEAHLDALQRERDEAREQLAAERARVERLQLAYLDTEDDFADIGVDHYNANNPHTPVTRNEFKRVCRQYLRDGDLPADEAVTQ